MRKAKFISILLTVLLLFAACSQKTQEISLYDRGLEVIALMEEAINSDSYLDMLSASDALRGIIAEAAAGDYRTPKAVYAISFSSTAFNELADIPALPETLLDVVTHRLISTITSQINAGGGVETLAASTMCTIAKTFVCSELKEDMIYLYTFEQGYPIAVTFTGGEDQTVTASANVILYDGFTAADPQSIQEFLGSEIATVTDITRN